VVVEPGLRGSAQAVVTEADTAGALGSGDVPVLGTPRLLALAEAATVAALRPVLPAGSTSVGTTVHLDHVQATPVGVAVTARAVLHSTEGRLLHFDVVVAEEGRGTVVGHGRVTRAVVDRARFLERLSRPS
jgi:predicted thioesterase